MRQKLPANLIVTEPVKKSPVFVNQNSCYHIYKNHPVDPHLKSLKYCPQFISSPKGQFNPPLPINDFQMFLTFHRTAFPEGNQKLVYLAPEHLK